ncbi:hypothetical protein PTI98_011241 [Pleurotus ostreatus]|nr:hypothetical protein PTI98_011241 [Pleurotus ostreatus]
MCISTTATQPDNCGCTIFRDLWNWIMGIFSSIQHGIDGLANCTEYVFVWVYEHIKDISATILHGVTHLSTGHPYLSLILLLLICVGPILLLVTLVIFEQAVQYILFFFGSLLHGFGGSPSRWYWRVNDRRFPSRDRFFLRVQSYSERYNKTSTDRQPFLVVRVVAALLSIYFIVVIWKRWW